MLEYLNKKNYNNNKRVKYIYTQIIQFNYNYCFQA